MSPRVQKFKSDQRPSMAVIARQAGVCKATVSLALRGDAQIPASTRARIEQIARDLGYRRNPLVAHLLSELRRERSLPRQHTLALINANDHRDAFSSHVTLPIWVEGCRRRAATLGYGTDCFWLHEPEYPPARLQQILRSRGIEGVIVLGSFSKNHLPENHAAIWKDFACVVAGVRTHQPTLSFCCVDHHELVIEAANRAFASGYRRPALVIDSKTDRLLDGRLSSATWLVQSELPKRDRIPAFLEGEAARLNPEAFRRWFRRCQPDVLLTLYPEVKEWLAGCRVGVPRDVGVILLERRPIDQDFAGMDQHNDLAGEAAVDLVVSMIHNREFGPPATPRATLIAAEWVGGPTIRQLGP